MHRRWRGSVDARMRRFEFDQPRKRDWIIFDVGMRPIGPLTELPQFPLRGP